MSLTLVPVQVPRRWLALAVIVATAVLGAYAFRIQTCLDNSASNCATSHGRADILLGIGLGSVAGVLLITAVWIASRLVRLVRSRAHQL